MAYEIVYGKEEKSDYMILAAPKELMGKVDELIRALRYPEESAFTIKSGIFGSAKIFPDVFCYTKGEKSKVLSCIKYFSGRSGDYFAQHLVFEENDMLINAGPAWLIKRRKFYINTLADWSKRDKEKIVKYDWRPIIRPSDYCIGLVKRPETQIDEIIKLIAGKWNDNDEQKFVLLFDPKKCDDSFRIDFFYELYVHIHKDKRWNYQFCTFDGQRGSGQKPPTWNIVFVADNDVKTKEYYKNNNYKEIIVIKGDKS